MDKYIQLESDENIFTDIIEKLGAHNVQVSALEIVEPELLSRYNKIYGAILLFPYNQKHKERTAELCQLDPSAIHDLTFVPQMQDNSCGMMAILHVLLNINDSTVVGSRISTYKDLFETVSSEMRGTIIAQQTDLIEINNNYEMHHPITIADQKEPKENNHYCAFIPFSKVLYQMDGLLSGPVVMDGFDTDQQFREVLCDALQTRIQEIVSDDPNTNSVAVLIVHESLTVQYTKEIEAERRVLGELHGDDDAASEEKREEIAMHENRIQELTNELHAEEKCVLQRKSELELLRFNPIRFYQQMMKEYMKDAMRKGTYKEIVITPPLLDFIQLSDKDIGLYTDDSE